MVLRLERMGPVSGVVIALVGCTKAGPDPAVADDNPVRAAQEPFKPVLVRTYAPREGSAEAAAAAVRARVERLGIQAVRVSAQNGQVRVETGAIDSAQLQTLHRSLGRPGRLTVQLVDDDHDVVGEHRSGVPEGVVIERDITLPGADTAVHFARRDRHGHSLESAREALEAWAASLPLPAGREVAVMPVLETDPGSGRQTQLGWRTWLLHQRIELTNGDIATAIATSDESGWGVHVTFTESGRTKLAALTSGAIDHRFAIVVDGVVQSAPIVRGPIDDGKAVISVSHAAAEAEATLLASMLDAGSIPVLELVEETVVGDAPPVESEPAPRGQPVLEPTH